MHIRSSLIPDPKPTILVNPAQRPLHHPAEYSQATAVLRIPLRQKRLHSHLPQTFTVRLRIVAPIRHHRIRLGLRVPDLATYRRQRVVQGGQLFDVWHVRTCDAGGQRDAMSLHNHMALGARLARSTGPGAVFSPPYAARIELLSMIAKP